MEPGSRTERLTCGQACRSRLYRQRKADRARSEVEQTLAFLRALRERDSVLDAD